jgi:hypothetical protein
VYELTEWGRELEPVVLALGRWGSRGPFPDSDAQLSVDAFVIALKTLFDGERAGDMVIELRLGEQRFRCEVRGGRLAVARGAADGADAVIETDPGALSAVLWHGAPASALRVDGDGAAADAFLRLFPPPRPAAL